MNLAKDIEAADQILRVFTWRSISLQNALFEGISDVSSELIISQYNVYVVLKYHFIINSMESYK